MTTHRPAFSREDTNNNVWLSYAESADWQPVDKGLSPTVLPSEMAIGEAMLTCVLLDHYLMNRGQCG